MQQMLTLLPFALIPILIIAFFVFGKGKFDDKIGKFIDDENEHILFPPELYEIAGPVGAKLGVDKGGVYIEILDQKNSDQIIEYINTDIMNRYSNYGQHVSLVKCEQTKTNVKAYVVPNETFHDLITLNRLQ